MNNKSILFLVCRRIRGIKPSIIRKRPVPKTILSIPKVGITIKPVRRLPRMLPIVEKKKISPEIFPTPLLGITFFCRAMVKGEIVPRKNPGVRKIRIELMKGPLIRVNCRLISGSEMNDRNWLMRMLIPLRKITEKYSLSEGYLSASLPPK